MLTINKKYVAQEMPCTYTERLIKSMLKTTFKVIMLFVLLVLVAVATGVATYNITVNMMEEQRVQARQTSAYQQITETHDSRTDESDNLHSTLADSEEYYLVRLEGDALEVYVSYSGKEEFLYNREVYKNDLSEGDLKMLQNGVMLGSASELTAFIENFTS